MDLDDPELVGRCLEDQDAAQDAFRALYQRHGPAVFGYLRGQLGESDAGDCLQETFLRVFRGLSAYDRQRAFRPWILGIATYAARDRLRSAARRPAVPLQTEPLDAAPAVAAAVSRREERALMDAAVLELPADEREVFLLKQGESLTYDAVAEAVGCSVRTVKNRMRSAHTLLAIGLRRRGLVEGGQR